MCLGSSHVRLLRWDTFILSLTGDIVSATAKLANLQAKDCLLYPCVLINYGTGRKVSARVGWRENQNLNKFGGPT